MQNDLPGFQAPIPRIHGGIVGTWLLLSQSSGEPFGSGLDSSGSDSVPLIYRLRSTNAQHIDFAC
jgi:hypothetical protein